MKVYCKNCRYFPKRQLFGKRLATCKKTAELQSKNLSFYSPEYESTPDVFSFCNTQNQDNDCWLYEEK